MEVFAKWPEGMKEEDGFEPFELSAETAREAEASACNQQVIGSFAPGKTSCMSVCLHAGN